MTIPDHADDSATPPDLPVLRSDVAFRLLVDAVQDYAIFLVSVDGRVLSWNLGAQRIKGYSADEIIGKHFSAFYTAEDRDANRPMRVLRKAIEEGRFEDEGWRVRKDGTRFWADVIVTALTDEAGQTFAFAKVTRDLTERLAAEEQRRNLLAEQRGRTAAEEALLARDRFLSIASHELKTPVASLQLAAESVIRARAAGKLDEERLVAGIQRITTSTRRLGVLLNELLDVSRLTADSSPLDAAPVDLVSLVAEIAERFSDGSDRGRIRLAAPDAAVIAGDASRLDQVVTNLVDNALKYSAPPTPVDIEIRQAGSGVEIAVADRGLGLDADSAERIFEAFGRGANAEHIQGLGLGLHIAHQIVLRHGGRIAAEAREDGPGATFSVWLPRDQATAE
ncbi:MAG TPA: PAS domain-containing sensor histidine kinase [Candidatus Binatia bacterium]|nr:PAS domain-containing sensor histidine kinase [Candidatus Binatia bacterium]